MLSLRCDRPLFGQVSAPYLVFLRHQRHAATVRDLFLIILPRVLVRRVSAPVGRVSRAHCKDAGGSTQRESAEDVIQPAYL